MLKVTSIYADGGRLGKYHILDNDTPVFTWAVASSLTGNYQTACRVTVGDLWDSGWVATREQTLAYAGPVLPHGVSLTVTVTVRDKTGTESEPMTAPIVSGVLSAEETLGCWIGVEEDTKGRVLYFRKKFTLDERPVSACLYACGLGYHSVKVNGTPVTNAKLEPAHANYASNVYYSVYPYSENLFRAGENTVEISVAEGWRHNRTKMFDDIGRMIPFEGPSQLWAMLVLRGADHGAAVIPTDSDWEVAYGPITQASIYNGETYDAAKKADMVYKPAVVLPAPGGVMRAQALEPITVAEEYEPIELTMPKPGMFVADFGQNIAGAVRIRLPKGLKKGQQITLRFAEELKEDGTLFTEPLREAKCTDVYRAAGDGTDLCWYLPAFTFHGFRYCAVTGLDSLEKEDLVAELWCTELKNGSNFTCGSALINQLQKMVVKTEMDNMMSILTDCPQRNERMAWMNDATVRFEETPYNFNIGRMFPKVVRDIRGDQIDGAFACCAPYHAFGARPADPVCSSYLVAAYEAWMHTGNMELLKESFDGLAAWENVLLSRSDDYIVNYSYYGDWAGPYYACEGGDVDAAKSGVTDGLIMSTGYSYYNCKTLAKLAKAIGREEDTVRYADLAEKIQAAFLARWHDGCGKIDTGSEGAQAFALWLEILPEEVRQAAADLLAKDLVERDYKFTTGNLCTRYMADMLAKYGYADVIWTLLTKETYPSYGYMIQNEATTVWERFELKKNPGMNSHNHPMYGAIGYFFYAWIAGVTPTEPGWSRVRIAPTMPTGLCSAHAVIDTVKGDITVRWSTRYDKKRLFVQLPFGVTADVEFAGKTVTLTSGYHVIEAD